MRPRAILASAILAGAVLAAAACDRAEKAPPPPPRPAAPPAPASAPVTPPGPGTSADVGLGDAFQAAFGARTTARRVVERENWGEVELIYTPDRLIRLGDTLVLVSRAETTPCHACYGALAIHYLQVTPQGLKVTGAWPELLGGSSNGAPPEIALRDDLFDGPALVASGGWTGQGCTMESQDLVELTPDRPVVRAKALLALYHLDDGPGPVTTVRGAIRPGVRGRSFQIAYSGDRSGVVRYALAGDRYQPVGGPPRLPSC